MWWLGHVPEREGSAFGWPFNSKTTGDSYHAQAEYAPLSTCARGLGKTWHALSLVRFQRNSPPSCLLPRKLRVSLGPRGFKLRRTDFYTLRHQGFSPSVRGMPLYIELLTVSQQPSRDQRWVITSVPGETIARGSSQREQGIIRRMKNKKAQFRRGGYPTAWLSPTHLIPRTS